MKKLKKKKIKKNWLKHNKCEFLIFNFNFNIQNIK